MKIVTEIIRLRNSKITLKTQLEFRREESTTVRSVHAVLTMLLHVLRSNCVLTRPRPHYALWTCSKLDHVLYVHNDLTMLKSVSATLLLRPTRSCWCQSNFPKTKQEHCWEGGINSKATKPCLKVIKLKYSFRLKKSAVNHCALFGVWEWTQVL